MTFGISDHIKDHAILSTATKKFVTDQGIGNPHTDASNGDLTILTGTSWLQPNLTVSTGDTWTIDSGGTLHVTVTLTVDGTLVVNGDSVVIG